mgnify:CR=1 FL=1
MTKLSIILPVYKVEQYIEKCIRSLEEQDLDKIDYEILVIDDGSPDNSTLIVEHLQTEFPNIAIYHKENGGLSSARNYGIERAKGKYCWFVDSDDYIESNVLKTLLQQLETYELDYVGFNLYDIIQGKKRRGAEWREEASGVVSGTEYIRTAPIVKSACVHILRTEVYQKYNLRFTEGIIHEDYEFVLRMYKFCNRMKFIDLAVYNYVIRDNSSITSIKSYVQSSCSFDSWYIILKSLQNHFNNLTDSYSYYARFWINNYKYIALTNLLVKPLPFKEKKKFYEQYKSLGTFQIGSNHLSLKMKIRAILYRIPFLYLCFMYILNKKYEN